MAQILNFTIDDTSPTISYLPFADTFPPNLTAGWNSFFSGSGLPKVLGETGNGTSFHVTSHDQATLTIEWRGIGIQVSGDVQGSASYTITLDGTSRPPNPSPNTLAAFQNLADEIHTLLISAVIPSGGNQSTFFFDSAVIHFNTSSSSPLNLQPLNNSNIFFQGKWGLQNVGNIQYHQSQTKGDVVQSKFNGASFLLRGATSPQTGMYSVVLDNSTSILNGQSTFTNPDTLLFYATGLDPTVLHDVEITNEDGSDLLLKLDGFQAFTNETSSVSTQPTSSPPPGPTAGNSKGTLAAFVLAGILGFLIISGLLYFFFVIRPQRRRDRLARIARRIKKEKEAGPLGVLNIAPTVFPDDMEPGSQEGTLGHHKKRSSEKSGFARWKREVEGGFGNLLGITFRHSGSTGKKSGRSGASGGPSMKSSVFTLSSLFTLSSSKRSHGKGKKKAKSKQVSESSLSTGFALELPVRPDSADSFKEKDAELSRFSPDTYPSESDMHTLSYMNTPSVRPVSVPTPAPPSHSPSGSSSKSRSRRQHAPRSSSHGHLLLPSQSSSRRDSIGLLLSYDDPKTGPREDMSQTMSPPSDPRHLSTLEPRDRGSARYSSDDAASYYLGSAATRLAIRGLRPRTTQSPEIQPSAERIERMAQTSDKTPEPDDPTPAQLVRGAPSPPNSDTSFLYVVTPASRPIDISPAEIPPVEIPPVAIPELPQNAFLEISPSSPFRIDFPGNSSRASSHLEPLVITHTQEGNSEQRQSTRTLGSAFRLTPPSNPPSGNGRSSFLDLGTSSNMSSQLQSIIPSENSTERQEIERSRWSTSTSQTTNLSRSGSSNVSVPATSPASGPTSYFPYPVSLPLSPYHPEEHIPSRPAQSHPTVLHIGGGQADRRVAQLRLSAFGSPTDSVPMSVTSERRLRHSGSTSNSGGGAHSARLLPHPPLPSKHSRTPSPPS